MKYIITSFLLCFLLQVNAKSEQKNAIDYVKNEGQWNAPFLYKADLNGAWVFLEKNRLTYSFLDAAHLHHQHGKKKEPKNEIIKGHAYHVNWLNVNKNASIKNLHKKDYYHNYYLGNNKNNWKSNVGIYNTILYQNIYDNIDFKIYSDASSMKTDYIIHKNGQVQDLQFQYEGVDALNITPEGKLKITTSINTIYELKPYAYQNINGKQYEVACQYKLNQNILTFSLPNSYNKNYDLVIDPVLVFSTYSGSFSDNWGSSATHDNAGNMFLGGIALGGSYPTTVGAFQTTFGGGAGSDPTDIAITKFNSNGTAKLYSTYLGGSSNELLASLYCTNTNELIAVLATSSTDFPTTLNAYNNTYNGGIFTFAMANSILYDNGSDIAISKFNATGTSLIGSTYLGGSGNDGLNQSVATNYNYGDDSRSDIAVDKYGDIYITSTTASIDILGTSGKAQPSNGGGFDGLLAKFNPDLSSLKWATYYGGSGDDASYSIGLDKNENIFICGGTNSTNLLSTTNGIIHNFQGGDADGFIAKFDNNGQSILAASYLGTNDYDQAFILDLDIMDNVYVFGQTVGEYPVSANVYSNIGASQFIHKLNNSLNTTSFSTVFGTENSNDINITPTALLVDVCNNIYAVGWGGFINTFGNTFDMPVTSDAVMDSTDGSDFYLINLSENAANLVYATYFGETGGIGDHVDGGTSRFDKNGIVYQAVCASCAGTNEFPTTAGVIGPDNNSNNCNMAGFKFDFKLTGMQIITVSATPNKGCQPLTTSFSYTSTQPGIQWHWDFGDGTTSNAQYPTHTYMQNGTYTVRFFLKDSMNCNPIDSASILIEVGLPKSFTYTTEICQGDSIVIGQEIFKEKGTYLVTIPSTNGCDSIVTLNLNILPAINSTLNKTICRGQIVSIGNQSFNRTGEYDIIFTNNNGCDSIVHLNLLVTDTIIENSLQTICKGDFITIGNQQFNTEGTYNIHLSAVGGCDSLIQLTVIVVDTARANSTYEICFGDSILVAGQYYKMEGNYSIHLKAVSGCDSLIQLAIITKHNKETSIFRSICEGDSVKVGNQYYSKAGDYEIHLNTSAQCDSTIHLTIQVLPSPVIEATADKQTVRPNELIQLNVNTTESLTYHWIPLEPLNNALIQNPTAQISISTWFFVHVVNNQTQCDAIDSVHVNVEYFPCTNEYIYIPTAFTPNGDGNNDILYVRSINLKEVHLEIYNRWGVKVFESNTISDGWNGTFKGQTAPQDVYGYIFRGECLQGETIQLKGNITLIK